MNIVETQKQTPLPPLSPEQQQDIQHVKNELTKHLEEKQELYRLIKRIKEPCGKLEDTLELELVQIKNIDSLDEYSGDLKPFIAELKKVNATLEEITKKNFFETLKFLFSTRTRWNFDLMVDFQYDILFGDQFNFWEE